MVDVVVDGVVEDGVTVLKVGLVVGKPVAVEPAVVEAPGQEHALEILEGIAEHADVYDTNSMLVFTYVK